MLGAAQSLLGEFKLHGANLREPLKGRGHQDIHADVPKKFADDWWVANGLFLFDDMTDDNGPTRVIPGSHKWPSVNVPLVNIADWVAPELDADERARIPEDLAKPHPDEVRVQAPAGSVVIINSALWHSGTENRSGDRRRVLHLTYTRRDLPQQIYQRDHLTKQLYDRLSPAHRFLFDVEPIDQAGAEAGRMPKKSGDGWWN
jgi:ectoine hydroxylase-related dioxygenase (phytanoyl-CoA dioxygenase family)